MRRPHGGRYLLLLDLKVSQLAPIPQDKQIKGGATQKPKRRGFSGDAQLPEKLKLELEAFFQPHRAAFAQLLQARKVRITRLTDESKKAYLV